MSFINDKMSILATMPSASSQGKDMRRFPIPHPVGRNASNHKKTGVGATTTKTRPRFICVAHFSPNPIIQHLKVRELRSRRLQVEVTYSQPRAAASEGKRRVYNH